MEGEKATSTTPKAEPWGSLLTQNPTLMHQNLCSLRTQCDGSMVDFGEFSNKSPALWGYLYAQCRHKSTNIHHTIAPNRHRTHLDSLNSQNTKNEVQVGNEKCGHAWNSRKRSLDPLWKLQDHLNYIAPGKSQPHCQDPKTRKSHTRYKYKMLERNREYFGRILTELVI